MGTDLVVVTTPLLNADLGVDAIPKPLQGQELVAELPVMSAQRRGGSYAGITVYEHPDFRGTSVSFRDDIPDLREEGWNDRISSLRPAGFAGGGRGNVMGNRDRRGHANASQSRLVIYDRPNFRGDASDILNSATNLGSVGDRARSVEVYGGTWELCEGAFRNARCVTVNQSVPDLRNLGFRSGVTSVREAAGQTRGRWF